MSDRPVQPFPRSPGLLAGMRIRKKLIFLHTLFSLSLAAILALSLRPAIHDVVRKAETHEATLLLELLEDELAVVLPSASSLTDADLLAIADAAARDQFDQPLSLTVGHAEALSIPAAPAATAIAAPLTPVSIPSARPPTPQAILYVPQLETFITLSATLTDARDAVLQLYVFLTAALLAAYALVAVALELFVLPKHVYRPIRAILAADAAVRQGDHSSELIPPSDMPSDELGQIMRSRNDAIRSIRTHQRDLADALARLETVATDLKRKNHLIEKAQQNLAGADRLASLGLMSAGLAHELNTPLAVLKGIAEQHAAADAPPLSPENAQLMLRVVTRLEKLSESLLDIARVRPPNAAPTPLKPLIDEAWYLVTLDPASRSSTITFDNTVAPATSLTCDRDRMLQVFINLLRNAAQHLADSPTPVPARRITVAATPIQRDNDDWLTITITDTGPGIDPDLLPRLFEPFVSTRMDDRGTGLGLAVCEGIVREHQGILLARNAPPPARGAIFEITLPSPPLPPPSTQSPSFPT